jgi:hypothetical protein
LENLQSLTFDINNKFLVGVGKTDFFVVDLREGRSHKDDHGLSFGKVKTFPLQPFYEEIKELKFCTNGVLDDFIFKNFVSEKCKNTSVTVDPEDLRCYIVAKVKNSNMLHVFEYFLDSRLRKKRIDSLEQERRSKVIDSLEAAEEIIYKRFRGTTDVGNNVLQLEISGKDIFGNESYHVEISHNFRSVLF